MEINQFVAFGIDTFLILYFIIFILSFHILRILNLVMNFFFNLFIIWYFRCGAVLGHFQYHTLGYGLVKTITHGPHYTSILQIHVLCNVKGAVWSVFSQYILQDVMINYQFNIGNHNNMTVSLKKSIICVTKKVTQIYTKEKYSS